MIAGCDSFWSRPQFLDPFPRAAGGGAARLSVLACASDRGEGRQDASPQGPGQQGERGDDEQPVVATREGLPAQAPHRSASFHFFMRCLIARV